MIHAIYIYFIINAFIAGIMIRGTGNLKSAIVWFLFGVLFHIWIFAKWIDIRLEISTLFVLYFTDRFKTRVTERGIAALRRAYTTANRYQRWVLRQIDKKYNYGITKPSEE